MNFLDILLIIIVAMFLVRGILRGLVKEIVSLASIGLAYFAASRYHDVLLPHLKVYISSETTIRALSYVLIFMGVIVVCWIIAKLIRQFLELALLGWLDRIFGAVFGAAEGVLIGLLVLLLLRSFFPNAQFLQESVISPKADPVIEVLADFTPDTLRDSLKQKGFDLPRKQQLEEQADEALNVIEDTVTNEEQEEPAN